MSIIHTRKKLMIESERVQEKSENFKHTVIYSDHQIKEPKLNFFNPPSFWDTL